MAYILAFGFSLLLLSAPVIQPILIFFAYIKMGNQLDAAKAFTTIALFNLMRFPFAFLPMGLAQWTQARVGIIRISRFLLAEEIQSYVHKDDAWFEEAHKAIPGSEIPCGGGSSGGSGGSDLSSSTGEVVISINDASLGWLTEKDVEIAEEARLAGDKADEARRKAETVVVQGDKATKAGCCSGGSMAYQAMATQEEGKDSARVDAVTDTDGVQLEGIGTELTSAGVANVGTGEGVDLDEDVDVNMDGTGALAAAESVEGLVGINRGLYTLEGISLQLRKGQLLAVVGTVGSGKSSFISALIGELTLKKGSMGMRGSIAYCDQKPWILNATLRNNVLFGLPYDEQRFDAAVHAASLEDDLSVLPGGAETEIGERGINLSGGQKARVALARAVYRDADVYLLDDPLSAVDAHVCDHLFRECIQGALKDKTVVLVTHQAHLLSKCDLICVLDQGKQLCCDTYDALSRNGMDLNAYLPQKADQANDSEDRARSRSHSRSRTGSGDILPVSGRESNRRDPDDCEGARALDSEQKAATRKDANKAKTSLTTTEERNVGHVENAAYMYYIRSGGMYMFGAILVVMSLGKCCELTAAFHLATWSKRAVDGEQRGDPLSSEENMDYLNMYVGAWRVARILFCCTCSQSSPNRVHLFFLSTSVLFALSLPSVQTYVPLDP
jgi:ABC-type multidrug transport system fused ATPase/permease subunit